MSEHFTHGSQHSQQQGTSLHEDSFTETGTGDELFEEEDEDDQE